MAERTVEVAIKARDEASQVLKDIVGTFGAAARSTEQFREDLAKTDAQFGQLLTASKSLRGVVDSLKDLNTAANSFKKLSDQLDTLNTKLTKNAATLAQDEAAQKQAAAAAAAAAAEYRQLQAALNALNAEQASVTARQEQLTKTLSAATKFEKLSKSAEEYETKLASIGVETDKLSGKQKELQRQVDVFNNAMRGTQGSAEVTKLLESRRDLIQKELNAVTKELDKGAGTKSATEKKLEGVIERLAKLGEAAKASGVDIRELGRPITELEAELASVTQQAGTFEGRLAPVNGALKLAGKTARDAAADLKTADTALRASQSGYANINTEVQRVSTALDELRGKLNAAGVDTKDFAAAQNSLQQEFQQTQRELIKTEGSINRYSSTQERAAQATERAEQKDREAAKAKDELARSTRRAGDEQNNFLEKGRTSLSFFQRLRGQVLSLVSAYVGLYGVIEQTRRALEVGSQLQGAQNTLLAANDNNSAATADELQYTADVANRLGQDLLKLTQSYGKLRVASAESGISLNSTRLVFEALNESATVLRLNADQTERVFYAVTQIFSKGKITAEELTQQLGDNLPGALSLLAKGLGVTEAALLDQVKAGEVSSAALIALATESRNTFGGALPQALSSSRAEFNRLNNEITKLRVSFFESAEDAGLAEAIKGLAEEFKKPEFVKGVKDLGVAFVEFIKLIPSFIEKVKELTPALSALFGLFIGKKIIGAIRSVAAVLAADLVIALDAAAAASIRLGASLNVVVAALVGIFATYQLATWAREQVEWLDKFADRFGAILIYGLSANFKFMKNLFVGFVTYVKDAYSIVSDLINGRELFADTKKQADKIFNDLKTDFDNFLTAWETAGDDAKPPTLPAPEVAGETPGSTVDEEAARREFERRQALQEFEASLEAEAKALTEAEKKAAAARRKAAEERLRLQAQVRDAILEGEQTLAENIAQLSGDPQAILAAQLSDVEEKYRETYEKIDQIKGAEGDAARARLDELVANEQAVVRAQAQKRGGLVTELQDALLEATGRGVEVELAKLQAEFDRRVAILTQTGQTAGIAIARELFNKDVARVQLDELLRQYDESMSRFQAASQAIASQVEIGDMTQIEAQREQNRLREETLVQVQQLIPLMDTLANSIGNPQLTERVRQVKDSLVDLRRTGVERTVQQLQEGFASGLTNALDSWIMGISSAKEAFAAFAADFLRRIAQMIIQQQILNLLQQSSGAGGILGAIAGAAGFHTGGVIGRDRGTPRRVDPAIFASAARYHSGGMVGLRSDEVPAILQRGEEVLSRSDPRNAMNGGGASQPVQVKVVNTIDSGDFVTQGLSTARGQEAVLNVIRANRGAL